MKVTYAGRDDEVIAERVVMCGAARPGRGRLLLPGPLHLLRAARPARPRHPLRRMPLCPRPAPSRPRPSSTHQYHGSFNLQHPCRGERMSCCNHNAIGKTMVLFYFLCERTGCATIFLCFGFFKIVFLVR